MVAGRLYIVSTPIGNLEDLTRRAERILRESDLVVCEDTRVTRKLLNAYDIDTRTTAYHAHSSDKDIAYLVDRLLEGENLALVSDAGTPLVSDPGRTLVEAAVGQNITVVPIPGPSATLAALVGATTGTHPFAFIGFLPRTLHDQRELVGPLAALRITLIFYESAHRVSKTLSHLAQICGSGRSACVARELTKQYETFERGTLGELVERFTHGTKGEVVIVVGPKELEDKTSPQTLANEARRLLNSGIKPSEAAKTIAGAFGIPKKQAYTTILELSQKSPPPDQEGDD